MAVVGFSDKPEHNWVVARWVYRQVLEDVISQFRSDSEMVELLVGKTETDGLLTEFVERSLATRTTSAIKEVATGILSGAIQSGLRDKPYGDPHRLQEYRKGLEQLIKAIPSPEDLRTA